jgi:NitT/TauT family transport system ATP-binding protein
MTEPILVCCDLIKAYPGAAGSAVSGVNLVVRPGEFVCFVGPSGCGKSTILRMIGGLETPTRGQVLYKGQPVRGVTSGLSMVFQSGALLPWLSVRDNVAFGLHMQGLPATECQTRADHFIEMVGLQAAADRTPRELSGGMRQRAGIARALAMEPEILLLDEPFSALDPETTHELHEQLLRIWQTTNTTMIMISHLIDEALELADRIIVFEMGRVHTELLVALPRPRDVDAQEFMTLRHQLAGLMHR